MKKNLLLSLSLVALVGLVDSASAMKRKNEDVPDEKNKKTKLIWQEEFDNQTEEDVIDAEKLKIIEEEEEKPQLKKLLIDGIVQTIAKYFDTKEFYQWVKTSSKIHSLIYTYEKDGNPNPLCDNNRPMYGSMKTLMHATRANNIYFIKWFLKSKQYSLADEIILLAFEKRYFKAIQLFLNDEKFMSSMGPDRAGILPVHKVVIEHKKHVKMLLDSKFFMEVYNSTDRMLTLLYILSSDNTDNAKIDKKIIDVFFTHAAFVAFLVENLDPFFIFIIRCLEDEGDTKPLTLLLGNEFFMKIFKDNGHAGQLLQQVSLFAYSFALGALLDNAEFMKLITRDDAQNAITIAADDETLEILTTHESIKELLALNEEN